MEAAWDVVNAIQSVHERNGHDVSGEQLSWYVRHQMDEERHASGPRNFSDEKKWAEEEGEDDCCLGGRDMFGPICAEENDGDY